MYVCIITCMVTSSIPRLTGGHVQSLCSYRSRSRQCHLVRSFYPLIQIENSWRLNSKNIHIVDYINLFVKALLLKANHRCLYVFTPILLHGLNVVKGQFLSLVKLILIFTFLRLAAEPMLENPHCPTTYPYLGERRIHSYLYQVHNRVVKFKDHCTLIKLGLLIPFTVCPNALSLNWGFFFIT